MERFVIIMEQAAILIADDNPEIREIIQILLSGEGFQVHEAASGTQALGMLKENTFDLIILDIMMPGLNGYQTCLEIRKSTNVPILFLSARTQESDKTLGFSSGGDDYLAKPFSYAELVSRAKALIRRYQIYQGKPDQPAQHSKITYHQLTLDERTQEVTKYGVPMELTDTEYSILLLLLTHPGQIFPTEHLYESIWNEPYYYGANNVIMVHIRNLRRKIEDDPKNPTLIKTVWGRGYRCDKES